MKAPATIYTIWDTLARALDVEIKKLDEETLLFLASDKVSEVNGLIAERAQEELALREVDYH